MLYSWTLWFSKAMSNHQRTPNLTNGIQVCLAPILDLLLKHAVAVSCQAALATLRLLSFSEETPPWRHPLHGKKKTHWPRKLPCLRRESMRIISTYIQNYEDVKERENWYEIFWDSDPQIVTSCKLGGFDLAGYAMNCLSRFRSLCKEVANRFEIGTQS